MAVRSFDGSDDEINLATGALSAETGADVTVAAVMKRNANSVWHSIVSMNTSADGYSGWGLLLKDTGAPYVANDLAAATFTITTGDSWVLVAYTKAAGTVTPRYHKCVLSSNTWTHANGGATQTDGSAGGGSGKIKLGTFNGGADRLNGSIAAVAIYQSVLNDAAVEALRAGAQAMLDATPAWMVLLNQASTGTAVEDLSATGTGDQTAITGTAVVSGDDPPGFSFTLGGGGPAPTPPQVIVGYRAQP